MNGELRKGWEDVAEAAHLQSFEIMRLKSTCHLYYAWMILISCRGWVFSDNLFLAQNYGNHIITVSGTGEKVGINGKIKYTNIPNFVHGKYTTLRHEDT